MAKYAICRPYHRRPETLAESKRVRFTSHIFADGLKELVKYQKTIGWMYAPGTGNLARSLLAPTVYGSNAEYPDGDWPTRSRIWKFHQDFMGGMTQFLRTDPSVPAALKQEAAGMGRGPELPVFDEDPQTWAWSSEDEEPGEATPTRRSA